MKAMDVIKLLRTDGGYEIRQNGSHKIFQHTTRKGIVVVPMHGKKDLRPGTFSSILKQAGIK